MTNALQVFTHILLTCSHVLLTLSFIDLEFAREAISKDLAQQVLETFRTSEKSYNYDYRNVKEEDDPIVIVEAIKEVELSVSDDDECLASESNSLGSTSEFYIEQEGNSDLAEKVDDRKAIQKSGESA